MGPLRRSHRAVADAIDRNKSLIHSWATRYNWTVRISAWDAHLDKIKQDEQVTQLRELVKRVVQTGEAYVGLFAKKLSMQLDGKEVTDPIPLNAPGFVAVSGMIVKLSGWDGETGATSAGVERASGGARAQVSADELVAATMQLAASGRAPDTRSVVLTALAGRYGPERLGLPVREVTGEPVPGAAGVPGEPAEAGGAEPVTPAAEGDRAGGNAVDDVSTPADIVAPAEPGRPS